MITVKRQSDGPRAIKFTAHNWESGDLFVGAAECGQVFTNDALTDCVWMILNKRDKDANAVALDDGVKAFFDDTDYVWPIKKATMEVEL